MSLKITYKYTFKNELKQNEIVQNEICNPSIDDVTDIMNKCFNYRHDILNFEFYTKESTIIFYESDKYFERGILTLKDTRNNGMIAMDYKDVVEMLKESVSYYHKYEDPKIL